MTSIELDRLQGIGLSSLMGPRLLAWLAQHGTDVPGLRPWRLVEIHRETCVLHDGHGPQDARPLPRLVRALQSLDTGLAVGDWVLAAPDAHGAWWVHERVEPSSHIYRRDTEGSRHPVVSNLDTLFLVMDL